MRKTHFFSKLRKDICETPTFAGKTSGLNSSHASDNILIPIGQITTCMSSAPKTIVIMNTLVSYSFSYNITGYSRVSDPCRREQILNNYYS